MRIVSLVSKAGFDFDDDVSIQRIYSPAQLSCFEFVLKLHFDRINPESFSQKVKEQMSSRIVMLMRADRLTDLPTVISEQ